MKKTILFSAALLFLVIFTHAQVTKGSIFLGGGIGIGTSKNRFTDKENVSVSITPSVGYAIKQNTILGINLLYSHSKSYYDPSNGEQVNNSNGISIFGRKYLVLGKGFSLFGETSIYYQENKSTNKDVNGENEQKGWVVGANLYPGVSYAVSKKFNLEASLPQLVNFNRSNTRYSINGNQIDKIRSTNFNIFASSFSNINLGFRVFLAK